RRPHYRVHTPPPAPARPYSPLQYGSPRSASPGLCSRDDEAGERVERQEVLVEVLRLVHHDREALLDGDRELDEVERVEADRALDTLRQRRLERHIGRPSRLELEPRHENCLQLVEDFLGIHRAPSAPPTRGPRGARATGPCA